VGVRKKEAKRHSGVVLVFKLGGDAHDPYLLGSPQRYCLYCRVLPKFPYLHPQFNAD